MKFTLEINLENDAVATYPEIEQAITRSLQLYHDAISLGGLPGDEDEGIIRDEDGNQVGQWAVTDNSADPIERMYNDAFNGN
jgi:hypothetical protein